MRIFLAGNVMLGRLVNEVLRSERPSYPWGDLLPLLRSGDLRLCNLECVVSDRGSPWGSSPDVFRFHSDGRNVETLAAAGLDAVCLANDHAMDFDDDALLDMLNALDAANIRHAGAGSCYLEACLAPILEAGGRRVGLMAFTDQRPEWEATDLRPGIFHVPLDLSDPRGRALLRRVEEARAEVDLLIASVHWGPGWGSTPPAGQPAFARALVHAGADLVFGHSPHVFRGIEVYRGKPIIYGAGDFVDDYALDSSEHYDRSFLYEVEADGDGVRRLVLHPTVIRACQARLAHRPESEESVQRMEELCRALGTVARRVPAPQPRTGPALEIPVL